MVLLREQPGCHRLEILQGLRLCCWTALLALLLLLSLRPSAVLVTRRSILEPLLSTLRLGLLRHVFFFIQVAPVRSDLDSTRGQLHTLIIVTVVGHISDGFSSFAL